MQNEKINVRQFTSLVCLYILGSSILIVPSGLAAEAKKDAWMAAVLSVALGIILVFFYSALTKNFSTLTLEEASEKVFGKWIGKAISILFFSFIFLLSSLVLRNIGDFFTTQIMTKTPILTIHIIFLLAVIFGARQGIEVIARTSEIFFPWIFILLFLLIVLLMPQMKLVHIQPMLEEGFKPIIKASIPFLGTPFLELIALLMIHSSVNRSEGIKKGFIQGTLLGGVSLIIIIATCLLVLGPDFTARNNYPTYILAKKIKIGEFIERVEVIVAIIWILTIYFKLVLLFYISAIGLSQTFRLKDYRLLLLPLGMLAIFLSLISYPNVVYMQEFVSKTWAPYASIFGLILPVLLLIVAKVRKISS